MLTHMLGNSYSMQDFLAYTLAAAAIIATGFSKATKAAQLPLLLLAVVSLIAERMLVQSFPHYLDVDPAGQVGCPCFHMTKSVLMDSYGESVMCCCNVGWVCMLLWSESTTLMWTLQGRWAALAFTWRSLY